MCEELKMWLLLRADLPQMTMGKALAQAGHAFINCFLQAQLSRPNTATDYMRNPDTGIAKIVLKAKNEHALRRAYQEAIDKGLPTSFIIDTGRTIFTEPTATCVAIGPCYESELPSYVRKTQLL